jgi:hypothetical protein
MDALMGQVGLIPHGTSWIAKAIQKITRSDTCHAVINIGNGYTFGAEPGGAKIRPIEDWPTAVWSRFDLTQAQAYSCADWAKKWEGADYAYLDDALLGLEYAFNFRWPRFIAKHFSNDSQWMCSELADAALTLGAGITVFDDGREFCEVAPGDFQQLFAAKGWWPWPVSR